MKRLIFLFFNFWHYYCFTQPFDNLVLPNNNLYYFDYQSYPIRIINTNKTLRLFHTPPSYSCISRLNEVIFAVDGESILNKNFDIALNSDSLYGNIFTFKNKALSIREIKDTSKYLIFTPNSAVNIFKNGREGELYYSRFDLNLDNGLGGIHKEEKNLFLKKQILAKMTYTHSCDGTWLLVKEYSDKFLAFKIGRDGRVSNPVVSKDSINLVYNTNSFDLNSTSSIGEMELSKDGSILANFYGDTLNYISLYKFDKITGIISGHNKIYLSQGMRYFNSLAFSRIDNVLYFSEWKYGESNFVSVKIDADLNLSERKILNTSVVTNQTGNKISFQVGYDGNIYFFQSLFLHKLDTKTGVILKSINDSDGRATSFTNWGFPHKVFYFPVLIPRNATDTLYKCTGAMYKLYSRTPLRNITWNGLITKDTLEAITPGRYIMTGIDETCTYHDTIWLLDRDEKLSITRRYERCEGSKASVSLPSAMEDIRWIDTNSSARQRDFDRSGKYPFSYKSGSCSFVDTIEVVTLAPFSKVRDTVICNYTNLSIDFRQQLSSVKWSDGTTNLIKTISQEGIYFYEGRQGECVINDTFEVKKIPLPKLINISNGKAQEIKPITFLVKCQNAIEKLVIDQKPMSYDWSGQRSADTLLISQKGIYQLNIKYETCIYTLSVNVEEEGALPGIKDFTICPKDSLIYQVPPFYIDLKWQDIASSERKRSFKQEGLYIYTAKTASNCPITDTITIKHTNVPLDFIKDTIICEGKSYTVFFPQSFRTVLWENFDTSRQRTISKAGRFSYVAMVGSCPFADTFYLKIDSLPKEKLPDTIQLCKGKDLPTLPNLQWQNLPVDLVTNTYEYRLTTLRGCISTHKSFVKIKPCVSLCKPILPNVAKIQNNAFDINVYHDCGDGKILIRLYDRYGNKMIEQEVTKGTNTIEMAQGGFADGVYVYVLEITAENGEVVRATGDLLVLKN